MRFVSVRDLRGKSAEVWRSLSRERELVITSNGKPIAILSATDEDRLEQSLGELRRVRATDAVATMQRASVEAGRDALPADQIDKEIKTVRRGRRR